MPAREGPVTEAGFSVVAFESWLKERDQVILDGIAAYNRDDCVSTWMLRSWLEGHRSEAVVRWPDLPWDRPVADDSEASEGVTDWLRNVEERVAGLTSGLAGDDRSEAAEGRRLLADLLDWHRREEKSQWWRWYELRNKLTDEELVAERDAIGGLEFVADLRTEGRVSSVGIDSNRRTTDSTWATSRSIACPGAAPARSSVSTTRSATSTSSAA